MPTYLDFEQPIAELEGKIEELRHLPNAGDLNIAEEVARLQQKADKLLRQIYSKLSPWQKTLVARHIDRPHFSDYVASLIEDYTPLAGDRLYADDRAIQGGLGRFRGRSVLVLGHEKGTATTRMQYNWGMAKPEGYRKAQRLMETADRFNLPLLVFVDTPGAYPGVEAEARGQAEAIARSIEVCLKIRVPFIATVIGEGGSGGAIALAAANRVLMMEHAVYSVISPEGCAAILWRNRDEGKEAAAEALKLTAQDLLGLGIIDQIVPEPLGGAHRGKADAVNALGDALERSLNALTGGTVRDFRADRRGKFLSMGRKGLA